MFYNMKRTECRLTFVSYLLGVIVVVETLRIGTVVDKVGIDEVEVSKVNGFGLVIGVEVLVEK